MRKLLIALALLLGVIYIFTKMAEVQAVANTLKQGDVRFVLIAIVVEGLWLLTNAALYQSIYRTLGLEEHLRRLTVLAASANFVNVVAPTAGMGGMAVFISESRRRGHPAGRVTVAGVLFVLFDYAGFLIVLALGLSVLDQRHNLTSAEIIAAAVLLSLAGVLAFLIYLGMHSEISLANALTWMAHTVNRLMRPILRREYLSENRARAFAHDAAGGLQLLRRQPINAVLPLALALTSKALLIIILFLMFLAFKVPVSFGTVIAGFSIGYLFLIVSPTPSGIGVVEGALTLALNSLGVPLGPAAVITLAYRGITFWLALLAGLVAFRWLSREEKKKIETSIEGD